MLAVLENINKSFGENIVFKNISARIHEGDRIGLVGINGAGKSTLLNVLTGCEAPDGGQIIKKDSLITGYLKQNTGLLGNNTIMDEMKSAYAAPLRAQKEMERISERLKDHPNDNKLYAEYTSELNKFVAAGGYDIDVSIKKVLNGLGFSDVSLDMSVSVMSGGEKTRLSLARLLLKNPDLLILDEPTNHLDLDTLNWLEDYLKGYKGAILTVSHDRYFLDKVVDKIWDIDDAVLTEYKGNYTSYKMQKAHLQAALEKEYLKQQNRITETEDFIRRNLARKSTSAQAKSRIKQLESMERIEFVRHIKQPVFSFNFNKNSAEIVLKAEGLCISVNEGKKVLADNVSLDLKRKQRAAIIGANGAGKSTLLKSLLTGNVAAGNITWGKNSSIGSYDQENADMHPQNTVLDELWQRHPSLTEQEARGLLGRVLISGDNVFKRVSDLSGGERAKLGMAILMGGNYNVLVLDEPTNHLDLSAREALEDALKEYDGTILFVSHDRYFVNALSDCIYALDSGKLIRCNGNFEDYIKLKSETNKNIEIKTSKNSGKAAEAKFKRRSDAETRKIIGELEQKIRELEKEELQINKSIEENPTNYEELTKLTLRLDEVKKEHEETMLLWLDACS